MPVRRLGLRVRRACRASSSATTPTLAWGLTNLGADVTDFFLERVDGTSTGSTTASSPITSAPRSSTSTAATTSSCTVRQTVHGPIDLRRAGPGRRRPRRRSPRTHRGRRFEVALGWTALQPGRTDGRGARDQRRQGRHRHPGGRRAVRRPVAEHRLRDDRRPHRLPGAGSHPGARGRRRRRRSRPTAPGPDRAGTAAYDWQGFVDPADMPRALDPAEGFVVAANQAVTPAGVGPFLT